MQCSRVPLVNIIIQFQARPQKIMMAQIKTFAFLDLETTGLPQYENNRTRITELTIMAVQSSHLSLGLVPRVQQKFSLCFNPMKRVSIDSEDITGLSNSLLEYLAPFSSNTVHGINNFLQHSPKPICFVAHNGNHFDYPILHSEICKTGESLLEGVLCIDTLEAFREFQSEEAQMQIEELKPVNTPDSIPMEFQDGFDKLLCSVMDEYEKESNPEVNKGIKRALEVQKINETTPLKNTAQNLIVATVGEALNGEIGVACSSKQMKEECDIKKSKSPPMKKQLFGSIGKPSFKLSDVFQRLTNLEVKDAHRAENDVMMLAMCAAILGDKFVDWANKNARPFADIPKMVPGRKVGT